MLEHDKLCWCKGKQGCEIRSQRVGWERIGESQSEGKIPFLFLQAWKEVLKNEMLGAALSKSEEHSGHHCKNLPWD